MLVSAGDARAEEAAKAADAAGIETVVVTAQRREQSSQDLGVSLTTLSKSDLERRDVTNVNDLTKLVPSLQVEPAFGSGQPQFRLRGIGFSDYASNNAPAVGVNIDQVAFPVPIMTQGQLFDIARVEVLRGPQGTLYGRNTTGGAVNFLTADPTAALKLGATTEYNSLGEFKGEGYVSGGVSDRLRLRLAAATDQGGGWQFNRETDQSIGEKNVANVRVKADADVTDSLNVKLSVHYGKDQSENVGTYLIAPYTTPSGTVIPADTSRKSTGWGLSSQFAALTGLSKTEKPSRDNDSYGASAIIEQTFDRVKVTDIVSYEGLNRRELDDWDGTSVNSANVFFSSNAGVVSNELRLSSNGRSPLQWIAGLYYSRENLSDKFIDDFMSNYGFITQTSYHQNAQTVSEFGQVEYNVTDSLKLIGGLRNEHEDRKLTDFRTRQLTSSTSFGSLSAISTEMNKVSGKIGAEYRIAEPALVYATISRGVKSGGFSAYNTLSVAQLTPFRPEEVLNYETGVKTDLFNRRLRVNGSVYFADYRDQQVQSAIWDPVYTTIGKIVNAPKSELYGGELEVIAEPVPGLRVSNGLGYSRGRYTDFTDLDAAASRAAGHAVTVDKSGRDLGFPKLTYVGSVSYTIQTGGFDIVPEVSYSYRGAQTSNWGELYNIDPYWLVDLGLTVKPEEGNWAVTLYGKNVLNTSYDVTRNYFTESSIGVRGEPAAAGVRLKVEY